MAAIRPGNAADLEAIAAIQVGSPEAAQWDVAGYLQYSLLVAVCGGQVAGFLVWRTAGLPAGRGDGFGECEILNLAVSPDFRRKGIARALVGALLESSSGSVFLEVRASNTSAILLYKYFGFQQVGKRDGYYENPPEAAIVMKFHSC